jgi:hypothetical protein
MGYARLTAARRLEPECAAAGRRLGPECAAAACATATSMGHARLQLPATAAASMGHAGLTAAGRRLGNTGPQCASATAGMGHAGFTATTTGVGKPAGVTGSTRSLGASTTRSAIPAAGCTGVGYAKRYLRLTTTESHSLRLKRLIRTGMGTNSSACRPVGHTSSAATSGSARVMATIIPTAVFCSLCSRQQSCYPTLAAARSFQHGWAWRAGDGTTGANVWR